MHTNHQASALTCREAAQFNHALQPTPVGVGSSAFAGYVTSPAWLSLGR